MGVNTRTRRRVRVRVAGHAAAGIALTLVAQAPAAASGMAMLPVGGRSPAVSAYVRARAADIMGDTAAAGNGYAAALAAAPGDATLGLRALRQGIMAGDRPLAEKGAAALSALNALPSDGALLLLIDAVNGRDWKAARGHAERIARDPALSFLTPVLRAWIAFGSRDGDPLALLAAGAGERLAGPYSAEHRALLLLALRKRDDAITAFRSLDPGGGRSVRLKLAQAAGLAAQGARAEAAQALAGDDPVLEQARTTLTARQSIPGAVDTAGKGVGELLVRLAADLNADSSSPLALVFARLSTFAAPDNAESWLVTAGLLSAGGRDRQAITALDQIDARDPLAAVARASRLQLLLRTGEKAQALAAAQAAAASPGAGGEAFARLGDLLIANDRQREAADAYARAAAAADAAGTPAAERWPLFVMAGTAYDQAGDWATARPLLEQAVKLAPDEPQALNSLGFAKLARGDDVPAATKLVERASLLQPDSAAITDSVGWAHYLGGDLGKAIDLLETASAGAPGDPEINEHLGDAYWRAGRRFEARYAWRAALVNAPAPAAARLSGKIADGGEGGQGSGSAAR